MINYQKINANAEIVLERSRDFVGKVLSLSKVIVRISLLRALLPPPPPNYNPTYHKCRESFSSMRDSDFGLGARR